MPFFFNVILLLWLIWLAYWIGSWAYEISTSKRKPAVVKRGRGIGLVLVILLLILLTPIGFAGPLGSFFVPESVALKIIGVVVTAFGIGFAIWARSVLGTNWSGTPSIRKGQTLTKTGPYSLVRHPIYTGILFGVIGPAITFGTYGSLLVLFLTIIFVYMRIRQEEKLMHDQFGKEYTKYSREVKIIIPGIL